MRRVRAASLTSLLVLVLMAATGAVPPAASAQDDAARFEELLASRTPAANLAGPFSGELVIEDGLITTAAAGVETSGFSAHAVFFNPRDEDETPWDVGFSFHETPDAVQQIIIDSTGVWHYAPFPGAMLDSGFVPEFDVAKGAANSVDLVVDGEAAYLGVNDAFVTRIDLPPPSASDVQIGSGYFSTQDGRALGYIDFQVWSLASPPAADPAPTVSPDDAAAFAMILAAQSQAVPLAGPFTANLTEEDGRITLSWADVDLTDFHARATFAVPETAADIPWNVGFMFRASPSGTLRLAIDAGGNWYFAVGSASPAAVGRVPDVVTAPGSENTLDLIVADEAAVLGVNGAFAAVIDLPADTAAGDVAAGSAFFTDQTLAARVTPFRDFVVLPFDPDAVSGPEAPLPDEERFASLLIETAQVAPLAGPFAGRLVEAAPGSAALAPAGVALADFAAVAAFFTPADVTDGLWGAGFQFRSGADVTHRIVLGFNGEVYAVLPGASPRIVGTATTFDNAPGAPNALQVFVEEGRALIGVNGEFIAAVDLVEAPFAADVLVGAAFFEEDFAQGRITDYENFQVWEIA